MKGSKLMTSLLFLLLLVGTSEGIRFEEELIAAFQNIARRKQKKDSFFGGGESVGAPCKDPALCSGRSREVLMEKAIAKSKSDRKEIGDQYPEEVQENNHAEKANPDVLDIAGMDYSPAKRKPPIHN